MRQRGSCKEKFRVQSDMRHGALDTSIAEPELMFSLSSPQEEKGRGEEATFIECPSPRPSPHSCLAGRGRRSLFFAQASLIQWQGGRREGRVNKNPRQAHFGSGGINRFARIFSPVPAG